MKIYSPHPKAHTRNQRRFQAATQNIFVTPGNKNPETLAFMERDQKTQVLIPKQFRVEFVNGEADVDPQLGKWMCDNGHALKTKRLIQIPGEDD